MSVKITKMIHVNEATKKSEQVCIKNSEPTFAKIVAGYQSHKYKMPHTQPTSHNIIIEYKNVDTKDDVYNKIQNELKITKKGIGCNGIKKWVTIKYL